MIPVKTHRTFSIALLLVLIILLGGSKRLLASRTVVNSGLSSISGTVVDENGQSVGRAFVVISKPIPGQTELQNVADVYTDESSVFTFSDLPAGRYYIYAQSFNANTLPTSYLALPEEPNSGGLILGVGEQANFDIVLYPGGVVEGTVRDIDGNPVPDANLFILIKPEEHFESINETQSIDSGSFSFARLATNEYFLSATSDGYVPQLFDGNNITNGALDGSENGTPIFVTAPLTTTINVVLDRAPLITGTVSSTDGTLLDRVRISAYFWTPGMGQSLYSSVTTDSQGLYELRLHQGYSYTLSATDLSDRRFATTYFPGVYFESDATQISIGNNESRIVDFELSRYGQLHGFVSYIDSGFADANAIIDIFRVDDAERLPVGVGGMLYDKTNGEYFIDYLLPGEHVMHISPANNAYIEEFLGKTQLFEEATRIVIEPDQTTQLNPVLDRKGSIDVNLLAPNGSEYVGKSLISVYSATDSKWLKDNKIDTMKHQANELDAGEYLVGVGKGEDGFYGLFYEDSPHLWSAKSIAVDRNQVVEVTVPLKRSGKIAGSITYGGTPISNRGLRFTPADRESCVVNNNNASVWVNTELDGSYETGWLYPGTYAVSFGRMILVNGYELYSPNEPHLVSVVGGVKTQLNLALARRPLSREGDHESDTLGLHQQNRRDGNSITGLLTDRFENGIGGLTVTLFDADGKFVRSTTTSNDGISGTGHYRFDAVEDGHYYLLANSIQPKVVFDPINFWARNCEIAIFEGAYYPYEKTFKTAQLISVDSNTSDVEINMTLQATGHGTPIWPGYKSIFLPIISK